MADGTRKPIGQVRVNDSVAAGDPATGSAKTALVTATFFHGDTQLTDVAVDAQGSLSVLHATPDHPFWNRSRRLWTAAKDLSVGDQLYDG